MRPQDTPASQPRQGLSLAEGVMLGTGIGFYASIVWLLAFCVALIPEAEGGGWLALLVVGPIALVYGAVGGSLAGMLTVASATVISRPDGRLRVAAGATAGLVVGGTVLATVLGPVGEISSSSIESLTIAVGLAGIPTAAGIGAARVLSR